jgi:uncharacterized protein YfbU (UPF0304 family)
LLESAGHSFGASEATVRDETKLSKKDRLFLINQYKILALLGEEGEADYYQKCIRILESGYEFHYYTLDQFIDDPMSAGESREVLDILSMFEVLGDSYERLQDKSGIEEWQIKFGGFDGNNETGEMGYVAFLVEQDDRFTHVVERGKYNSHCPCLARYRRMLEYFSRNFPDSQLLTKEQMLEVVNAGLNRERMN